MNAEDYKILVIDDENIVRESLVAYLEDSGYQIIEATNGQAGLEQFKLHSPDAVLCDLRMPVMGGIDVLKAVKALSPDTPFIVVSGAGIIADVVEALRLGASDYIIKPIVELEVLEHSIMRNLERLKLKRENETYRQELEKTNFELELRLEELRNDQNAGRQIQRKMLPNESWQIEDLTFTFKILTSLYLSGDFVDYFKIDQRFVLFYIADVSGHGASSAFVTVLLKNLTVRMRTEYLRKETQDILDPVLVFERINQELLVTQMGKYMTMFYGVIDLDDYSLKCGNAGHFPLPVFYDGSTVIPIEAKGQPLGLFEQAHFDSISINLPAKFSLSLLSDGILEIIEASNLSQKEAKIESVCSNMSVTPNVIQTKLELADDAVLPDDVTILTVSRI